MPSVASASFSLASSLFFFVSSVWSDKNVYPYPSNLKIPDSSLSYGAQDSDGLLVRTHSGLIQGQMIANVRAFRSIPFAAPPVGELRWQDPQPVTPWGNDTVDASYDPPGCPQTCTLPPHTCPAVQSEDCLYLNIFAPSTDSIDLLHKQNYLNNNFSASGSDLNVFVFIHGGNFKQGFSGGLLYNGTEWVNYTNSIVITINYRLGALGSLWSEEAGMTGNYGFKDQQLALKWIHDNIAYFGGNNQNVTIFGQSAGAVSVALHMSQMSEDDSLLFQTAILESEPFATPIRDTITWGTLPLAFFNYLGCNLSIAEHDDITFWACLRNTSEHDIIKSQNAAEADAKVEAGHFLDLFMPWTPTVGTDLFASQPLFMFQQGPNQSSQKLNNKKVSKVSKSSQDSDDSKDAFEDSFKRSLISSKDSKDSKDRTTLKSHTTLNKVNNKYDDQSEEFLIRDIPYIIGTVMNEGNEFIYMAYPNGLDREQLDETLVLLVGPDVALGIREHYPLPSNTSDYRDYVSLVATDGLFKCPTRNATASHDSNGMTQNIFMYHFDHVSSFNVAAWGANYSECYDVVCHASELPYVFRVNLGPINSKYSQDEWILAKAMQKYWTDFGRNSGQSTGDGGIGVSWEPFVLGTEMSLKFQTDDVEMESKVDWDDSKCEFWDSTGYVWMK